MSYHRKSPECVPRCPFPSEIIAIVFRHSRRFRSRLLTLIVIQPSICLCPPTEPTSTDHYHNPSVVFPECGGVPDVWETSSCESALSFSPKDGLCSSLLQGGVVFIRSKQTIGGVDSLGKNTEISSLLSLLISKSHRTNTDYSINRYSGEYAVKEDEYQRD